MTEEKRQVTFEIRKTELKDLANDLRHFGRKSCRRSPSFALTFAGSAIPLLKAPIAAALKIASSLTGHEKPGKTNTRAYAYLFRAHSRYGLY